MSLSTKKWSSIVLYFIIAFIICNNLIFFPNNILSWDVFGYYLYLPFTFIYNDLGVTDESILHHIVEKYNNTSTLYQVVKQQNGDNVMKYSMGMSIFYAPFFFIGHLWAKFSSFDADGFSLPYQYAIFFGNIFYSIVGIVFLKKVLHKLFNANIANLGLILTVFGTHYIVQNTMYGSNAMSHNILFTTYAMVLYYTIKWHKKHLLKHAIALAFICGFMILSRPTEIVCLLIPILWNITSTQTLNDKINSFLSKYRNQVIITVLIIFCIGMMQFAYWKIYSGKFIYNSYGANPGEGLDLLTPYILKVLFSFRKGFFIYTPLALISTIGFIMLYRNYRNMFWALFTYFILNLYLISSWTNWWYAQSFSQRPLVPVLAVLSIPLCALLQHIWNHKKVLKYSILALLLILVSFNIFQTVQFHRGIIHQDRMTMTYYLKSFGKLSPLPKEYDKFLLVNRNDERSKVFLDANEYDFKNIYENDFEKENKNVSTSVFRNQSYFLDSLNEFSFVIEKPYKVITNKDHAWINIKTQIFVKENTPNFHLTCEIVHNGYSYKYRGYESKDWDLKPNQWNEVTITYLTPPIRNPKDKVKIKFWNLNRANVYIDDFQVNVYTRKFDY